MMTGFTACTDDLYDEPTAEDTQLGGMLNASADTYNINDGEFTAENWRQQEAIYIYDNQGPETDGMGRDGYTLVNLPWYDGDKLTNLPTGFCDDLTRENGWELALNRCGSRSILNNNFFAIYNKYTGMLRFFYYLPVQFQSGNDHVWQVSMTDNMAQNTSLRYGVPQDLRLNNKAKIGQTVSGNIVAYTTPWVNTMSQDGHITPNAGWWAFDVDLSLYSGKNYNNNDQIGLQMRSWQADHVSLNSLITANIDGSIKANIDLLQSQHIGNSLFGVIGRFGSMGASVKKVVDSANAAKWGDAFGAGIAFGKTVANMCGVKTESSQDIQGTFDGTVSLAMNGTISTTGIVQGTRPTENIASPTFMFKDFDRQYANALGEGIWNLETSPVVYNTNAQVEWRHDYDTGKHTTTHEPFYGYKEVYTKWGDKKSPFNAQKTIKDPGLWPSEELHTSKDPWCGYVNYFDPSSIKVTLNPNVFTEDEIEGAKVFATCGVRSANSEFGSVDDYRSALGLKGSQFDISMTNGGEYYNRPFTEAPFDALSTSEDKMGMVTGKTFPISKMDGHNCGMFGRGDNDYILEPIPLSGDDHPLRTYMPSYEVTVTLIVEHDGKTIVYSRTYLPEYVYMPAASMPLCDPIGIDQKRPANYVPEIFNQQMKRIRKIRSWVFRTLQSMGYLANFMLASADELTLDNRLKIKKYLAPFILRAEPFHSAKGISEDFAETVARTAIDVIMNTDGRITDFTRDACDGHMRLMTILRINKNTDYGKRYSFASIRSIKGYQNRVPITTYADYEKLIRLQTNVGEENILTAEEINRYAMKLDGRILPMTRVHLRPFKRAISGVMRGHNNLPIMLSQPKAQSTITNSFIQHFLNSTAIDFIKMSLYDNGQKQSDLSIPASFLSPFEQDSSIKRFKLIGLALLSREADQIIALNTFEVLTMFTTLEQHWPDIIREVEQYDAARAQELVEVFKQGFDDVAVRIWPKLQRIVAFGAGKYQSHTTALKRYTKSTTHNHGHLITIESIIAQAIADDSDLFKFVLENDFFEFLPDDSEPLLLSQVSPGMTCEVIVTNRAGLYRYRTGIRISLVEHLP